jgi:hypothetical protein
MLENFSQILQWLPTIASASLSSSHFGDVPPFKIQVDFYIFVFEGQVDEDALEKWLNLIEHYFSFHSFSDREHITFALLKHVPHVKHW